MVSFTAVATFVFAGFAATALAIPGASDNTWATMQKNNCGPQQVISCCNSDAESKQANGVLGVALPASIPAAQCAQIPINAAIIGGALSSTKDNKCSTTVACCNTSDGNNVNQNGLVNANNVKIIGDCSPVQAL